MEPDRKDYIEYLFESYELSNIFENRKNFRGNEYDKPQFSSTLNQLSSLYDASLRDIEKCFNILSYVLSSTGDNFYIFPTILAFIIMMYLFEKDFYRRIINHKIQIEELIEYIKKHEKLCNLLNDEDPLNGIYFLGQLAVSIDKPYSKPSSYDYFDSVEENPSIDDEYKEFIREIKSAAQDYRSGRNLSDVMKYIENKINFIDPLVDKSV